MAKTSIGDPLRRKNVALTPEETVRQWFISVLRDTMKVPEHMMRSEVGFNWGKSSKRYRADIVIFGRDASPVALVECKRPEIELDAEVLGQALRYDMALSVKWVFITNGKNTIVAKKSADGLVFSPSLPSYEDMLK
ncbi:MAG: type I restriction enzyme HsdR N-terminal domain-containing protein [Bacteroidales bacterium]|nr:type I restriction enzyme HsdR N-terminal domain-containing protein [Bacteroidales bacterium]